MSNITLSLENPFDIKEELLPHNSVHYEDDHRANSIGLDIDFEMYRDLYDAERLLCIVARDSEELVGYMTAFIIPNFHSKGTFTGTMDTLFVSEDHRNMGIASSMIRSMEEALINLDVSWFSATFRDEDSAESTVGKEGFKKEEVVYSKTLIRG